MIMITANDAKQLMGFDKAMKFINKKIKAAAMAGDDSYTYTTDYKAKANKIVKTLKENGYSVRFIHTPNGERQHKIIASWAD